MSMSVFTVMQGADFINGDILVWKSRISQAGIPRALASIKTVEEEPNMIEVEAESVE